MDYTQTAQQYIAIGYSVIPLKVDGSKSPVVDSWKPYQDGHATDSKLNEWFGNGEPRGIGVVAGSVSGNLHVIDFDHEAEQLFPQFWADAEKQLLGITNKILVVATPRPGRQVWFRQTSAPPRSQKLACSEPVLTGQHDADGQPICKPQVLIETRGTGGYVAAPGSHPAVHRVGAPYELIHGKQESVPQITDQEADTLLNICRSYSRYEPQHVQQKPSEPYQGVPRHGDIYNQCADIRELLTKHGWQFHHEDQDGTSYWTRPGKSTDAGCSATLGYLQTDDGRPLLYVFSSAASPLEQNQTYDAFAVFTFLEHGGDFKAAAAAARQLYEAKLIIAQQTYHRKRDLEDPEWPTLGPEALYGLPGDVVNTILPHTEADPAALLVQLLTAFGNIVGRGPYFEVEGSKHFTKLFSTLVGDSSKSRKGTSWSRIEQVLRYAVPDWLSDNISNGIGSGPVVVHLVRDPCFKKDENGETVIADPGVKDKRLLIQEGELANILKVAGKDTSTLSPVLRDAWDDKKLRNTVKGSPAASTGSHISIVGHITQNELRQTLTKVDMHNGFGNRFLWTCVRRSKKLPHGGNPSDSDIKKLGELVAGAAVNATHLGQIKRDTKANALGEEIYNGLK